MCIWVTEAVVSAGSRVEDSSEPQPGNATQHVCCRVSWLVHFLTWLFSLCNLQGFLIHAQTAKWKFFSWDDLSLERNDEKTSVWEPVKEHGKRKSVSVGFSKQLHSYKRPANVNVTLWYEGRDTATTLQLRVRRSSPAGSAPGASLKWFPSQHLARVEAGTLP